MNQDNLINCAKYPKSTNHKITWTKKDKIKTCDLNPNCMELIFDIKQNKNIKIINDNLILEKLPTGNPPIYETFSSNNLNYNIILLILVIIILIIFISKKN